MLSVLTLGIGCRTQDTGHEGRKLERKPTKALTAVMNPLTSPLAKPTPLTTRSPAMREACGHVVLVTINDDWHKHVLETISASHGHELMHAHLHILSPEF